MKLTVEQILKIKHEVEEHERNAFPMYFNNKYTILEDSNFIKFFYELKEWFKGWNIKDTYYTALIDNPCGETVYGSKFKETENFFEENYDLLVIAAIFGIHLGITHVLKDDYDPEITPIEMVDQTFVWMFKHFFGCEEDENRYGKFSEIFDSFITPSNLIGSICFMSLVTGMIRNKMKESTEESFKEFLKEYYNIFKKYNKNIPLIEDNIAEIVAPTYKISCHNSNRDVINKYGYIPAAAEALKCNPLGFYYQYNGSYYSSFVDYSSFKNIDEITQKYYNNHILKLMSNVKEVYENILKYMPIIGTRFVEKDPVLLKFIGNSKNPKYPGRFVLGCKLDKNNYIQGCKVDKIDTAIIICCDAADNSLSSYVFFGSVEGVNEKLNKYLNGEEMVI